MKIGIIGGGAAGLMAAAFAHEANPNAEVILMEKNDGLGKKVIISGGGRCNVTTGISDLKTVLTRYPRGGKFLMKAMHAFPPDQVFSWFEAHGVPLKVEEDLRVFPQSNNGKDIVGVFEKIFRTSPVRIWLKTNVIAVKKQENQFHLTLKDQTQPLIVDRLILTTGGQAYRHTGSTGDGYAFAQTLGHSLTPLAPSLNAFFTQETWPARLSGLSFEQATITAIRDKEYRYSGPFLFTHKGISGPAVFAVSSLVAFELYDQQQPLKITIDLFPDQNLEELKQRMEEKAKEQPKKNLANGFIGWLSKSFTETMCEVLGVSLEKKAGELSKKEIQQMVQWLKAIPLHAVARGAGDEFVTAGGVPLQEVNPSTMESMLCPGLFFAGEILDVDGFTGGFNLQASWATGHLAGISAAQEKAST